MDRGAAVILTAIVGGIMAAQAPLNGRLGQSVGALQAAFVSFVVGTVVLAVLVLFANGGYGQLGRVGEVPLIYLFGGLLGVIYVTTVLALVGTLGAGGITAATILGQLIVSLVIDRFGLFGVTGAPITPSRIAGVALLAVGVWLIVRK